MAVKSDVLVPQTLHDSLRSAFNQLMEDTKEDPDFYPDTNDMVHDLIHPSLYPLVHGRTRVLSDEVVGVADAIDKWSGKGDIIPTPRGRCQVHELYQQPASCQVPVHLRHD